MPRDKKISKYKDDEIIDLIDAFKYFDKTTTALNKAYRALEVKIDDLRAELEEKNRLLSGSVAETSKVKNFLSKILENMSSGVIVIDNSQKITLFNKMAGEITGFNPDKALGKKYSELFKNSENDESSLLDTLRNEKKYYKKDKTIDTADGEGNPVVSSTSIIMDENEEVLGAVEIFEDLSELKELQEEVRRNQTLVELGEMAANIAHEMRNPLGGIGGFATLLERDLKDDPQKQKLVRRIIEGINGLNKITTDVLMYTRKREPEFSNQNIKNIIQETIVLIDIEAQESNIKIEYKYPKEDVVAEIDPDLIKRMILNLLKNALHAMTEGGELGIDLSWKMLQNMMTVKIKDSGIGISEAERGRIFNPFYTTDSKGTGLGLAIVKRVVDVHRGVLKLNSETGKGTEFVIQLPLIQQ